MEVFLGHPINFWMAVILATLTFWAIIENGKGKMRIPLFSVAFVFVASIFMVAYYLFKGVLD